MRLRSATEENGAALLAVLWLSVALTMIAMTTSYLVRTEAAAVSNHVAAERAAFLAQGGIDAAMYAMLQAGNAPASAEAESGMAQRFQLGQRWLRYEFQEGVCEVEIVPENAKLNVNLASVEQLTALFALLGSAPEESHGLAEAIADWRAPRASSVASATASGLDEYYAGLDQPYEARHASLDELDELLAVKGMTRDLFFGRLVEDDAGTIAGPTAGTMRRTPPLADLLTTEPDLGGVNVNYAAMEVLRVLPGWDEALAGRVIEARRASPFRTLDEFRAAVPEAAARISVAPIALAPASAYTLTATARMRDSSVRRTVRARIRLDGNAAMGVRVTGWWQDWPWSQEPAAAEGSPSVLQANAAGGLRL